MLEFFSPKVDRLRRDRDVLGLARALEAKSVRTRRAAANALVAVPDRQALEALLQALGDPDELVRANTALALGEIEVEDGETGTRVSGALTGLLDDSSELVRALGTAALGRYRNDALVSRRLTTLRDDESLMVRRTANVVLSDSGDATEVD